MTHRDKLQLSQRDILLMYSFLFCVLWDFKGRGRIILKKRQGPQSANRCLFIAEAGGCTEIACSRKRRALSTEILFVTDWALKCRNWTAAP